MTWLGWSLAVFGLLMVWKFILVSGRLNVLHRRKDLLLESLEIQLAWREHIFTEILQNGDLPIQYQTQAARVVLNLEKAAEMSFPDYLAAESDFTRLLTDLFESDEILQIHANSEVSTDRLKDLARSCRRVALARRFHNDAVGALQLLRVRWSVRWLKLHGNTPWPRAIDMADSVPGSLARLR
jgi:hypothetical protein